MHGHRHVDWIGECGGVLIVSAPSPVMEATDCMETYFYVHNLAVAADGRLRLLEPERISVSGQAFAEVPRSARRPQATADGIEFVATWRRVICGRRAAVLSGALDILRQKAGGERRRHERRG